MYDLQNSPTTTIPVEPFVYFEKYDDFYLYMNPRLKNINDVPQNSVGLDDLTIFKVVQFWESFSPKNRSKHWPTEFDINGMIRGSRIPTGFAAKV